MAESLAVRRSGHGPRKHRSGYLKAATTERPSLARVNEVLDVIAARDQHGEVLTAVRRFPARAAEFADWPEWVRPELRAAYQAKELRGRIRIRRRRRRRYTPGKMW